MSADELDQQQPSSSSGAVARAALPQLQSSGSSWSYRNCREARAAGAAPIYRGQPGYGAHMDGDDDGIACESYPR
ncbi:MAG: calcium-binding protein [Sphingobium sp.]|nr:excalibur calcium-binding domain-containing protein [Sphingobium sp.]PZU67646.1 MAG: calcium-binding protein [Sphingobium sp.]